MDINILGQFILYVITIILALAAIVYAIWSEIDFRR